MKQKIYDAADCLKNTLKEWEKKHEEVLEQLREEIEKGETDLVDEWREYEEEQENNMVEEVKYNELLDLLQQADKILEEYEIDDNINLKILRVKIDEYYRANPYK